MSNESSLTSIEKKIREAIGGKPSVRFRFTQTELSVLSRTIAELKTRRHLMEDKDGSTLFGIETEEAVTMLFGAANEIADQMEQKMGIAPSAASQEPEIEEGTDARPAAVVSVDPGEEGGDQTVITAERDGERFTVKFDRSLPADAVARLLKSHGISVEFEAAEPELPAEGKILCPACGWKWQVKDHLPVSGDGTSDRCRSCEKLWERLQN